MTHALQGKSPGDPLKQSIAILLTLSFLAPSAHAVSRQPVRAKHGMVVSVSEIASRVGVDTLQKGGNAVDAAIAVGLALAVTWPAAGNIGGGGFMVLRKADGTAEVIDYRERAPLAATRNMYLDADGNVIPDLSTDGYKAIAVPGTLAGFALAHARHGKLEWSQLIEPARKLAAEGFGVSWHLERTLNSTTSVPRLAQFPESRRIFLRNGDRYREGDLFRQPELAATLQRIRDKGASDFYTGETARLLLEDIQRGGGIVTAEDLRQYEPTIRQPLRGTYRGREILTMPPPSSGGAVLIEMLNMLETHDVAKLGHGSADALHLLVETMRRAFADRAAYMADTDFVEAPIEGLITKEYARQRVKTINLKKASPSSKVREGIPPGHESPDTTHFTVIDREGNVVSNTYTLNESFGSAVTARGTGILLNNLMDDFTSKPGVPNAYGLIQSDANAIEPRKRPLSAMTPTIVLEDGELLMTVGSPGGPAIINSVLQVIVNVIDHGMNAQEAVEAPRVHHQWLPDVISWDAGGINPDTRVILENRGFLFKEVPGYSFGENFIGDTQVIMIERESGMRLGAADPRRGGVAVGY